MPRLRNGAIVRILEETDEIRDGIFLQPGSEIMVPNNAQVDDLLERGIVEVVEHRFRTVERVPDIVSHYEVHPGFPFITPKEHAIEKPVNGNGGKKKRKKKSKKEA